MANYVIVNGQLYNSDVLAHHGIKGMKWGRRRFQNNDGSLTPAGKKRYITTAQAVRNANNAAKEARKASLAESRATDSGIGSFRRASNKAAAAGNDAYRNSIAKDKAYNKQLRADRKKTLEKEYGELEDQMTYGKNANAKKNAALEKRMAEIDKELNPKSKKKALEKEYGELEDQMTYGKNANAKKNAALEKRMAEIDKELNSDAERKGLSDKQKKALKVGAAVAGTALAAYGAYKVNQFVRERNKEIRVGQELVKADEQIFFNFSNYRIAPGATDAQKQLYLDSKNKWANTLLDQAQARGRSNAKNDSFTKAAKNVLEDELRKRTRR